MYRTAYCGLNGVLSIEVSLYRTVYCGLSGVLSIEVSLYRTACCGLNGVLSIEVSLYRTAYYGLNGILTIEVLLYRIAYCGLSGVLSIEVSLYRTAYCGLNGVLNIEVTLYRTSRCGHESQSSLRVLPSAGTPQPLPPRCLTLHWVRDSWTCPQRETRAVDHVCLSDVSVWMSGIETSRDNTGPPLSSNTSTTRPTFSLIWPYSQGQPPC